MNKIVQILFLVAFIVSCNNEDKNRSYNTHALKVVEARGYIVPKDSMASPKVVLVDESKLKKIHAGKPISVATNLNIHRAGIPKNYLAGKPNICTPGKGAFSLPKIAMAIDSTFLAGIPETTLAKDMANKDQNPQNFSFFKKLQGLKHGNINCLLEDKYGNLWFGTYGGGVSKYDGKSFTHFTDNEGLSHNVVLSMLEDKFGNLWFGTLGGGVSKFDGKHFTHFTEKEGLSGNEVWSMLEDRSGNLWFGTFGGGVSKYDGKRFTHFTEKEGLSSNVIWTMLEDKSGNLWFGTNGRGITKYDGKSFTHFTEKEGLSNNIIRSIFEDKSGNLWIGTGGGGISKYDGKYFTHFTENEGLSNNNVLSILEDKSGNLWIGSGGGGLSKYDGKYFTHFTENEGLSNNQVLSILEDKSGNLWFGTFGGGVSKYDGKRFTHFTEQEGLNNNDVLSILKDKSGNIWFGSNGGGVSKYDGKSFSHYTDKEGLSFNFVRSILEDKSGNLWFGTDGGGVSKYDGNYFVHFTEKEGLSNNNVMSILEDRFGNLWFGTNGGGVSKYDGKRFTHFTQKEGLSSDDVRCILEDKSGNIWFATYGGGVTKYDGKRFTHFTEQEGLSNNFVLSIVEDKSGSLWFGTFGGGLSKYDGIRFIHITEKEGLGNNFVLSILEDKSGNLWFGTRFGLSKLNNNNKGKFFSFSENVKSVKVSEENVLFKNYNYVDGFLGIGVNGGKTMCEAEDGTIWIGANDRLTAMHPKNMPPDKIAPNIQLTAIDLFNENISWSNLEKKKDSTLILGNGVGISDFEFDGITKWYTFPKNLSLAYNNNYLTFNFIGITMNQPRNVKYQYKLEGLDENWSAITNKTSAPYGNIPHGTYIFKVKAMNSDGVWSKIFEYTFTIRPPFWKTWWFRTLIALIVVSTVWFYIKSREKNLVSEKGKLEKIVKERTAKVVEQKHLIEQKHKEITDSINYAERIQRALLASKKLLDENLTSTSSDNRDYFILFKPKDVVSGDFYWATKLTNNHFIMVTADSTGHGVPGAIMSLLNIACLDKAITKEIISPELILDETRSLIIENLKNDGSVEGGKDGMDGSLLSFDFENNILLCASANNPIWVIRGKELIEINADRIPIGKHDKDKEPFTLHTLKLQKGDVVYTLTDGFPDQFGGPSGKKFKYKPLQALLVSIANEPMLKQKQQLNDVFEEWKGDLEQVDDVCLIGVRV